MTLRKIIDSNAGDLVLGSEAESATTQEMVDQAMAGLDVALDGDEQQIDQVLQALYDSDRKAGLGSSCPKVNRWLGDIRKYFSTANVRMMQKDALDRLKLHQMLMQPETLEQIEPDIHLAATLLTLKSIIPDKTKATARMVVRKVVEDFERRLRQPLTEAVQGALSKVMRSTRPRPYEIDWDRTIRKNMRNYLPELQTIIPEKLVGYGKRRSSLSRCHPVCRSKWFDGHIGRLLKSLRSCPGFDSSCANSFDRL